jgi:hypothetical protein
MGRAFFDDDNSLYNMGSLLPVSTGDGHPTPILRS